MQDYPHAKKKKKYSHYPNEFKRKVCLEYLKGNKTKVDLIREFRIKSSSSILLDWLRKFGYIESKISCKSEIDFMLKPEKEKSSSSLEKENQDLKLQLEMYKRMIELAEKEFKIPIVKKSDTK